jgi:hypothetical protein
MKRTAIIALAVLTALLAGCSEVSLTGSGNIVTREETFTGFDKLDVSHGFEVDVRQAEDFSVVIRVDDNVEQYLEVAKQGSTLQIGLDWHLITLRTTLEAEITMPELTGLELSGGCDVAATGFESSKPLDLDVSGGCDVTLTGSAGDVTIDASGGSDADLSGFSVVDANVEASGGSEVTVNASGRLDADASGGAGIYYLGSPTLGTIEESGGGDVRRK